MFISPHISLHVTKIEKANEVFIKHYGKIIVPVFDKDFSKVKFVKNEIEIDYNQDGIGIQDLEISGLGWMSFVS